MNNSKSRLISAIAHSDKVVRPVCKYSVFACAVIGAVSVFAPEKLAIVRTLLFLGGS